MMNRDSAVLLSVAAGLVISCLCASASVLDTPDKPYAPNNPYKGIVERNLFAGQVLKEAQKLDET